MAIFRPNYKLSMCITVSLLEYEVQHPESEDQDHWRKPLKFFLSLMICSSWCPWLSLPRWWLKIPHCKLTISQGQEIKFFPFFKTPSTICLQNALHLRKLKCCPIQLHSFLPQVLLNTIVLYISIKSPLYVAHFWKLLFSMPGSKSWMG